MLNHIKKENNTNMSSIIDHRLTKWITVMIIGLFSQLSMSAQCDYTMACNDLVQISLSSNCTETITADMIIENPEFSEDNYLVVLELPDGTELDDPIVTLDHIGMLITAKVTLTFNDCNITCWGSLMVEDKFPPIVDCPEDMTVDCGTSLDPADIGGIELVDVSDCTDIVELSYDDESEIMLCEDIYSEVITRSWKIVDSYRNERICTQIFYIRAADIMNVVMPADFIIDCENLTKPVDSLTTDDTGKPTMIECANVQSYYSDLNFPLCGSGFKKRREWHVLDWCNGMDTVGYQTIKVEDTAPPTVTCGLQFYEIPSNVDACFATYNVPLPVLPGSFTNDPIRPIVLSDCSDVSYRIFYATFPPELDCNSLADAQEVLETSGEVLEFFEVLPNSSGEYIIDELPNGCNWIKYEFTDECGHSTFCTKDIFVYDAAPPAAICEGYTVVTIDDDGWAHILAESLDDHSWDYCDRELTYEARRINSECGDLPDANPDDEDFDGFLHFCCQDVGSFVGVELRVTDPEGNVNFCSGVVYVDDRNPPIVYCPANLELDCSQDYTDLNITGEPVFTDNCHASIHQTYREFLNDCGLGYVLIDHAIWDNAANQVVCTQRVDIVNKTPITYDDVEWPMDINAFSCDPAVLDPEVNGSKPSYDDYNSDCADIGVSMSDLTFYDVEGACLKIVRTWTLVDWCVSPVEYITHVQKILIFNSEAPEFSNCDDYEASFNEFCQGEVDILMEVSDDCTEVNDIDVRWTVDFNADGSIDESGIGLAINDFYPGGSHEVKFTAVDECGNETVCSYDIEILDESEGPTPVCLNEVVWVLDDSGRATIWASDFNFKSFDGCNGEEGLEFYFDDSFSSSAQSKDFDCSDLETDGIEERIALKMYVRDEDGNFDYCDVSLILQDNSSNACPDINTNMTRLEGTVYDMNMTGLEDVMVELEEMTEHYIQEQMTGDEGVFAFNELYNGEYKIKPVKYGEDLEGVSTLDLVLIQKHILGIETFDTPYKMIAADINQSNSISAVDLIEIRKLILGLYQEFPGQRSWDFVSMINGPLQLTSPWDYQNFQHLGALYQNMSGVDFVAVKIGDVNGSYSELHSGEQVENRSASQFDLTQTINAASIIIEQENDELINGYQFSLEMPEGAELSNVNSLNDDSFNESSWTVVDNVLKVSHANVSNHQSMALEITFAGGSLTEGLVLTNDLEGQSYGLNNEVKSISLRTKVDENPVVLSANYPNPFSQETEISLNVPESGASFIVTDVNGKVIMMEMLTEGRQMITVSAEDLENKSGIYFYTLKSKNQSLTRKAMLIK